jgi:hypothetical protein
MSGNLLHRHWKATVVYLYSTLCLSTQRPLILLITTCLFVFRPPPHMYNLIGGRIIPVMITQKAYRVINSSKLLFARTRLRSASWTRKQVCVIHIITHNSSCFFLLGVMLLLLSIRSSLLVRLDVFHLYIVCDTRLVLLSEHLTVRNA